MQAQWVRTGKPSPEYLADPQPELTSIPSLFLGSLKPICFFLEQIMGFSGVSHGSLWN